ncbi:hypothetical protein PHET_01883 [Paragonimus heterotremus]|uniref:C2H2-type domain-containing protein n=1 Tax=Paragonimus heterotremus TaxID=100268 RepID=A0A8J4SSX0_9TREM|nr:hypothetical protein PHET_01883 [Paragonimus heterotremus]
MRQRGATATAFSPGLYMDAIRALGSTSSASAVPPPTEASVGVITTDTFTASTLSPKLISISPVLSRIQSPLATANNSTRLLQTHSSEAYVYSRRKSTDLPESDCPSKIVAHNRALFDAKLRKKHKTRRAGLHQINGDVGRSLHSLKMTIRRTSQSHKVHPSVCTVVDLKRTHNGYTEAQIPPRTIPSSPLPTSNCAPIAKNRTYYSPSCSTPPLNSFQSNANQAKPSPSVHHVDACTSTLDRATITEPDLLGPCVAGTKVVVEGVVWLETTGMLVLNIHWRGRAYMGTLMDASRQNFGPSCVDKGITSALSLLRGRRVWTHGSPGGGRFRTRGMHAFHHHHHHHHHHHRPFHSNRLSGLGASMTTRSAAAAAAASSLTSTDSCDPAPGGKQSSPFTTSNKNGHSDTGGQSNISVYDIGTISAGEGSAPTPRTQRGTKRRRKRGAGASRPYRRVAVKSSLQSDSPRTEQPCSTESLISADQELYAPAMHEYSPPTASFSCPYPGCKKSFSDLLSMRYHFSMGHSVTAQEPSATPSSLSSQPPIPNSVPKPQDQPKLEVEKVASKNSIFVSTDRDHSTPSSPPPQLGRAHSVKGTGGSDGSNENSLNMAISDDRFDDNLAPPRLHRIVSITESITGFSQTFSNSSPSKNAPFSPGGISDEPPAPSPAYSDISDDGTVPAEQNLSFVGPSGPPLDQTINHAGDVTNSHTNSSGDPQKVFPLGRSILPPLAGAASVVSRHTGLDFKSLSPSMTTSPGSSHSPHVRHDTQNGFYFPITLLPSHLASSPSIAVSNSSASVMSVQNGPSVTDRSGRPAEPSIGEFALSSSLPLSTYSPMTQPNYLLHNPTHSASLPIGATTSVNYNQLHSPLHHLTPPHTVYIPGVNSFSVPPSLTVVPVGLSTNVDGVNLRPTSSNPSSCGVSSSLQSLSGSIHHVRHNSGPKRLPSADRQSPTSLVVATATGSARTLRHLESNMVSRPPNIVSMPSSRPPSSAGRLTYTPVSRCDHADALR